MTNSKNNETTLDDLVPAAKKYEEQLEKRFKEIVYRKEFEGLKTRVKKIEQVLARKRK